MKKIFNLTDEDVVKMIMGVFAAGHDIQDAAQVCGGLFEENESDYDKEFVKHFNRMHCYTLAVRSICKNNNLKTASELYNEWQHQTTDKKFVKGIFELYFMGYPFDLILKDDGDEDESEQEIFECAISTMLDKIYEE